MRRVLPCTHNMFSRILTVPTLGYQWSEVEHRMIIFLLDGLVYQKPVLKTYMSWGTCTLPTQREMILVKQLLLYTYIVLIRCSAPGIIIRVQQHRETS